MANTWNLIETYIRDNPYHLVNHHLDSFNHFFYKGIPNIFKENNPITIMKEHIPAYSTYEREIHLYLGGKDGTKIHYGKPIIYEGENHKHFMYPNEARLRNMSYACSVHYDVDIHIVLRTVDESTKQVKETKEISTLENIFLGRFPIMLHSNLCLLRGMPKEARFNLGECRNDPGGYFIIDGKEKVIVSQEIFGDNLLYVRDNVNETYSHSIELRTVSEDSSKPKRTLSIRVVAPSNKFTGKQIVVLVPNVKKPLPLFILFRALGVVSDKTIVERCLLDLEEENVFQDLFIPSVHDAGGIFSQEEAIDYISTLVKNQNVASAMEVLSNYFLPNIGTTNFTHKSYMLGYMVKRLLNVVVGKERPTDRDSFRYKRVQVSGMLLYDLFKEYYKLQIRNIRTKIDTKYYFDKSYRNNMKALIHKNSIEFFKDRIVEDGFKKAFKGRWGSQEYTSKDGVVQDLNRLSYFGFLAHLRKINLNMDSSAKVVAPRYLHATQWGIICPVHTPDGGNVGFHKHMSVGAYITSGITGKHLIKWLTTNDLKAIETLHPKRIFQGVKVFVNGTWVGVHFDPQSLVKIFHYYRRHGLLSSFIHILWDIHKKDIHFATDGGRLCRPVFYIDGEYNSFTSSFINENTKWNQYMKGFASTVNSKPYEISDIADTASYLSLKEEEETKKQNLGCVVEYLDTLETEGSFIAFSKEQVNSRHTHLEIHESLVLSILGNMVIFPEHNQLPRDLFSCGQTKQAASLYSTNLGNRIDTMGFTLNYGQTPIVKSRYYDYLTNQEHPYGENVIVAIGCYSGYNVEDALIFNEASVKRGMFRTTYFKMYEDRETSKNVDGSNTDSRFMNILEKKVVGTKPGYAYNYINDKGLVEEGTLLNDKVIMIGKGIPSEDNAGTYSDASVPAKKGQYGIVDKSFITDDEEGFRIAKIRIREERIPSSGDKFCSRAGQKGTIGIILPEEDMPFTSDGIRPDVIMNPHAIPSRMTIGHLVECIIGKACLYLGGFGDCTAFETDQRKHTAFGSILMDAGYHSSGNQLLYSGISGEPLEANLFFGPNYYLRLKHMVKDKINYRERGPRTNLTRQPVQGRSNDGGLRIGEMERDCLIAHGMNAFIKDSMMVRGDKYRIAVCNHTGMIAVYNEEDDIMYSPLADGPLEFEQVILKQANILPKPRHISKYGRSFSVVEVPYAFKLFMQEIAVMNVQMYILTDQNINQIEYMSGKEGIHLQQLTGYETYEEIRNLFTKNGENTNNSNNVNNEINDENDDEAQSEQNKQNEDKSLPKRKLAIIVPYYERENLKEIKGQNRKEHLETFIAHMRDFIPRMQEYARLNKQINILVDIYVVQQKDDETSGTNDTKFNRGALLNSGYILSKSNGYYPVVLFHDVDLLPSTRMVSYYVELLELNTISKTNPYKVAHYTHAWPRYTEMGERFIGGVFGIQSSLFEELNGFPNYFEGWGGEDEAFIKRFERYLQDRDDKRSFVELIYRPSGIKYDDYVDLENIETKKEKEELMISNKAYVNEKIYEGFELDSKIYKLNGLREGSSGPLFETTETKTIQNQENIKLITVQLQKNQTSFEVVSGGVDTILKKQAIQEKEIAELEQSDYSINDSDDEEIQPIKIMEDVKLDGNDISNELNTSFPNLTEKTLEDAKQDEKQQTQKEINIDTEVSNGRKEIKTNDFDEKSNTDSVSNLSNEIKKVTIDTSNSEILT